MPIVPEGELRRRIGGLQARLGARSLRGALFTARVDRFYFAGTVQEGLLWVPAEGDPTLFVLRDVDRARRETPWEIVAVPGGRELWSRARALVAGGAAGLSLDVLSGRDLARLGLQDLRDAEDVGPHVLALRRRKSPWEIGRLEETGRVAVEVFRYAGEVLRAGMTEAELAGQLFARAMELGHEGLLRSRGDFEAYSWHVLSGPNAARPGALDSPMSGEGLSPAFPWGAGRREIRRGDPVIVDFGVSVFGYQTDQTRTFCVGSPPGWLREAHAGLLEVHGALAAALRAGTAAGDVFAAGERGASRLGLAGYLGRPGGRCRFVGHGVGLEIVEPPLIAQGSREVLEASSAVALEPKAVVGD
ncbi:MAG: M24 family metallopeptidase, partial [Deferrisomatales bacterium]|nr:M24 family metallopeptidase [Deferrisomatales bacterium]